MNQEKSPLKDYFYGTEFYNYLFIVFQLAYNYLVRDHLLTSSIRTVYETRRAPGLGIFLLLVIAAGTYALMIKCRILRSRSTGSAGAGDFILWVLGWVITISIVFTAVQSFGIRVTGETGTLSDFENTVIALSIFGAMIQSGAVFGFIMLLSRPYTKEGGNEGRVLSDILAFIYLCVSYTVIWETIMYRSVAVNGRYDILTGEGIFNITGWFICFLLLYPPMRFPFIIQEIHGGHDGTGRLKLLISYIAVIITGILPLVKI